MSRARSSSILFTLVVAVVALGAFAPVRAQTGKASARDPGNPAEAVPPVRYDSAFKRYRPNVEADVGGWRDANDNVGRVGGWRVYGREALSDHKAEIPAGGGASGAASKPEHGHVQREAR